MNIELEILENIPLNIKNDIILKKEAGLSAPAAIAKTTTEKFIIFYNEKAILDIIKQTNISVMEIITHELFHLFCGHCHLDHDKYEQQKKLIASDCEVNSYLSNLQKDPFAYAAKFNLPNKKTFQYYYDNIKDEDCTSQKGICSLNLNKEQTEELQKILEKKVKEMGYEILNEHNPIKIEEMPAKRIPKGIRSTIERIIKSSLNSYFEKSFSVERPHSWKDDCFGKKKTIGPKLLFAIDCSGSTSGEQVRDYFSIVRRLIKEYSATICEFDDNIRHLGKKISNTEWGGGTNFKIVQNYAIKQKVDAIIWFTDGEGDFIKETSTKNIIYLTGNASQNLPKNAKIIRG